MNAQEQAVYVERVLARTRELMRTGVGWATASLRAMSEIVPGCERTCNSESLEGAARSIWKTVCAAVRP